MCVTPFIYTLFNKPVPLPMTRSEFSQWLCGFIDGEGNFQVFFDRFYLRVMFRIRLHIDDIQILYTIQQFLGVGEVRPEGSSCLFVIDNVHDLVTVLFPLLEQYTLRTVKYLDFLDFKLAVLLLQSSASTRIVGSDRAYVTGLILGMNSGRGVFDFGLIPD